MTMDVSSYACRLCLSTESLVDLFQVGSDNDNSLNYKITSCVDVKAGAKRKSCIDCPVLFWKQWYPSATELYSETYFGNISLTITPEDKLPSVICETCRRTINHFYDFKLTCLAVDQQLKSSTINCDAPTNETKTEEPSLFANDRILDEELKYSDRPSELDDFANDFIDNVDIFELSPLINTIIDGENYETSNKNSHIEINNTSESTVKSNTEIQCELCGCIFLRKSEFKKHLSTHNTAVKLVQCKYCLKRFTRAENAVIHTRSHLGIRPFVCDICGQTANKLQTLKRHMKIHSDERNYACLQCGCRFKRSGDLHTHMRTHTGARPYKCKLCENDYTSHSGLRKHLKMRHKNIPIKNS